jgi:ankyrin repeat protein
MNIRWIPRSALLPAGIALAFAIAGAPATTHAQEGGLGSINPFGAFTENVARVAAANDAGQVRQLLADGHSPNDVDDDGRTGLEMAAMNGNVQIATILIKAGAKLDSQDRFGNTPLHAAVERKQLDMVELLLGSGAAVDLQNHTGMTPLMIAARSGELDIVRALLAKGASVAKTDFTGRDAAGWAADSRRSAVIRAIAQAANR